MGPDHRPPVCHYTLIHASCVVHRPASRMCSSSPQYNLHTYPHIMCRDVLKFAGPSSSFAGDQAMDKEAKHLLTSFYAPYNARYFL